jgi:hypothetical protein
MKTDAMVRGTVKTFNAATRHGTVVFPGSPQLWTLKLIDGHQQSPDGTRIVGKGSITAPREGAEILCNIITDDGHQRINAWCLAKAPEQKGIHDAFRALSTSPDPERPRVLPTHTFSRKELRPQTNRRNPTSFFERA